MLPFYQGEENLTRRHAREESVARPQYIRDLRKQGRSVPEIKAILAAGPEA